MPRDAAPRAPVRINLALQGGGAHGAFTWGVLDRLLAEDWIEIAGISGTSAGALNGAALKAGIARGLAERAADGGRQAARDSLEALWRQVAGLGALEAAAWIGGMWPGMGGLVAMAEQALPVTPAEMASRVFSPYALGPAWRNPLERIVRRFDYANVCAETGPRLFVCATNVRSGKIRVFRGAEISTEAILASACLPTLFKAVEIDDPQTGRREAYWDGGYAGNPALFPLFAPDLPDDIVIVNINPMWREELPVTPQDIANRINEISFNSALLRELRAIDFVRELIADGRVERGTMKEVALHMIADDELMTRLSVRSKLSATPMLIHELFTAGRAAGEGFLERCGDRLGKGGSIEPAEYYG